MWNMSDLPPIFYLALAGLVALALLAFGRIDLLIVFVVVFSFTYLL